MKISEVIRHLEELAPPSLQESYDNSGLIVGDINGEVTSVLLCLDSIETVVEEAIQDGHKLIIAHHPIVFSGIKSLTGKNYIERTLLKAIKNDISIYAIHTNLDNVEAGVNRMIAEKIGLNQLKVLSPKSSILKKLVFFCPTKEAAKVRNAIFEAGAGTIGKYDACSFNGSGTGTFRANKGANPFTGEINKLHEENELRVETIFPNYKEREVIAALLNSHPYEEVAYDIYALDNKWNQAGSGMIGTLEHSISSKEFLKRLKTKLNTDCIRHTNLIKENIKTVAVCGGSGSFLLGKAINQKADIFITADFKYHQFFDADEKIIIADVGHYESEQYTPLLIQRYLQEKIPNFAVHLTKINTNPINYI